MAVTVKRATLWTIDTPNRPGTLAATLSPLAEAHANLDLVMGYSHPDKQAATIEVYPVTGARPKRAAAEAGFQESSFPCVTVTGENRVGLGRAIAGALAEAGINLNFFVAQVVGRQYTGIFSFEADSEADLAVKIIRKATREHLAGNHRGGSTKKKSAKKVTQKTATKKRTTKRKRRGHARH